MKISGFYGNHPHRQYFKKIENKIRDLFKVKLYTIRSETKKEREKREKREREREKRERERERKKKEQEKRERARL